MMQKVLLFALVWLMPAQAFHHAGRMRNLQLLLTSGRISTHIHTDRSLLTKPTVSITAPQTFGYSQPAAQNISWFSRLRNAWNNIFKQPHQSSATNGTSYKNFIKNAAAFSIGSGIGVYALQNNVCMAAELPLSWEEIKDPVKLQMKIQSTPDHEKPALAVDIIRYLASYLDSYRWRFALSTAITTYPEIAHIIVEFLVQFPKDITDHTQECVPVVEFLITHNKMLTAPIAACVFNNRSLLEETAYGPQIIALIAKHSSTGKNDTTRVIES